MPAEPSAENVMKSNGKTLPSSSSNDSGLEGSNASTASISQLVLPQTIPPPVWSVKGDGRSVNVNRKQKPCLGASTPSETNHQC